MPGKRQNPWISHLRAYWSKNKSKGISYKKAMQEARKTYKKVGKKKE